jgi:tRNA(Ile)-lysidine synthase
VTPAGPVGEAEFAALMARLGPHGTGRRLVAGVSGGADSMALALLLARWGAPEAVVIDHGLRDGSADEAAVVAARLRGLGIPARSLRLVLPRGAALGERARAARLDALLAACRAAGLPDLALGHHAGDQAETVALRRRGGSGPDGLAGIAAVAFRGEARVLRPLLPVAPERLRATLERAGVAWVEDPSNAASARGRLRAAPLPPPDPSAGPARAAAEAAVARELGRHVALHPGGWARIAGPLSPAAWSALVWTLSGRPHPPGRDAVARLARRGAGTLHGVRVGGGYAALEAGRADRRFVLHEAPDGAGLEPLGAVRRLRPGPPAWVLHGLPAVRIDGILHRARDLPYPCAATCPSVRIGFRPARPLSGVPFVA